MRCDQCPAPATRVAYNERTNRAHTLCKACSLKLPDSDTQQKKRRGYPLWHVTKIA